MSIPVVSLPVDKLLRPGLHIADGIHYQLGPDELIAACLRRGEGVLSDTGALAVSTGEFTGRSPKDRFILKDEHTGNSINWNDFNLPLEEKYFNIIFKKATAYLNSLPEIWIRDCFACADPRYRLNIRIITETPAMNLFAANMLLRPSEEELETMKTEWHILAVPGLRLNAAECGVRQHNAVVISFRHKIILLAGTGYTGEIKKAVFSVLNYILPHEKNVLGMHCAANMGTGGDTALFFGLSGTGKTTLSADRNRKLIGDDEHGWAAGAIFNFEGGCYAKCIDLDEAKEPEIYQAIRKGALVENVQFFPGTNRINFKDRSITENTRVSYPLHYIGNALEPSVAHAPKNIFFLTCDAYGVLPPVSRLSAEQAMYQFISGYTAKIAGTETGIVEPKPTFSACFGAPFMPLHPGRYASLLGDKIREQQVNVWLVNTGWSAGPYGIGSRIGLQHTRAMITAALEGKLDKVGYEKHPVFGMEMPESCPGIAAEMLNPRNTWSDPQAYDEKAKGLAARFTGNFEQYRQGVSEAIAAAGPVI